MTTNARIRTLLLILVPGLVAAAVSIIGMLAATDLPAQLAVHWGPDGTVDRVDGLGSYVALVAILVPAFVVAVAIFSIFPLRAGSSTLYVRTVVGLSIWFGVFIALSMYLTVVAQRGVADVEALPLSTALVPLGIAFPAALALAVAGALVAPKVDTSSGSGVPARALELAEGEQAYWSHIAHTSRAVVALPIALAVGITVMYSLLGLPIWATLLVVLVLGISVTMLAWRVVVDRRGITVTGLLGFPRFHTPIAQVQGAAVTELRALRDFGGWGIRIGRGGQRGVIVRSGEAIEVERVGKAPFVVTVDDAATGAGLLTTLARRASE